MRGISTKVIDKREKRRPLDCILRLLLIGVRDAGSLLSLFRGGLAKTIVPIIWRKVRDIYRAHIVVEAGDNNIAAVRVASLPQWPTATGVNVNMLPFIIDRKQTLPLELQGYWSFIQLCKTNAARGSVAYLTVQESHVRPDRTQRTPGLHVEAALEMESGCTVQRFYSWGGGQTNSRDFKGGIFMASTQSKSCAVLHCTLRDPAEVIGLHGNVEHLRSHIVHSGTPHSVLEAHALWWITGACASGACLARSRSGGRTRRHDPA